MDDAVREAIRDLRDIRCDVSQGCPPLGARMEEAIRVVEQAAEAGALAPAPRGPVTAGELAGEIGRACEEEGSHVGGLPVVVRGAGGPGRETGICGVEIMYHAEGCGAVVLRACG